MEYSLKIKFNILTGDFMKNSINLELILIPGGVFQMGGNEDRSEKPVHKVEVSSFYLGKYAVTNKEYSFYKECYGKFEDNLPASHLNWYDAVDYCNWLSEREELERCYTGYDPDMTKNGYRLPTEAEWEYACRAGSNTLYYWGDEMDGDCCWYEDNSENRLHPAGQKKPNGFGLYDMAGNIWEWCNDRYDKNYYSVSPYMNPYGPLEGSYRVGRGGHWDVEAWFCRSAFRRCSCPDTGSFLLGFRLCRSKV